MHDDILSFEILREDVPITKVTYNYKSKKLEKINYETRLLYGHLLGECDLVGIIDWFESRCFPRTRANCDELLRQLGLTQYVPLAIVRRTHGVMWDDDVWIRFSDEQNIEYKDVKVRWSSKLVLSTT